MKNSRRVKHVTKDGARFHVLSWHLGAGGVSFRRCSEPNCEVNYEK